VANARGFTLATVAEPHRTVPRGQVVSQVPMAGMRMPRATQVRVVVSSGSPSLTMPTLKGFPLKAALQVLATTGLKPGQLRKVHSATVPGGQVISSLPGGGEPVGAGAQVSLVISQGPPVSEVPRLLGMRLPGARKALRAAGFVLGHVRKMANEDRSAGVILRQSPAPHTEAARGSQIDLAVNAQDM